MPLIIICFRRCFPEIMEDIGYRPVYELRISEESIFELIINNFLQAWPNSRFVVLMPEMAGAQDFSNQTICQLGVSQNRFSLIEYHEDKPWIALRDFLDKNPVMDQDDNVDVIIADNRIVRTSIPDEILTIENQDILIEATSGSEFGLICFRSLRLFKNFFHENYIGFKSEKDLYNIYDYVVRCNNIKSKVRYVVNHDAYCCISNESLNNILKIFPSKVSEALVFRDAKNMQEITSSKDLCHKLNDRCHIRTIDFAVLDQITEGAARSFITDETISYYHGLHPCVFSIEHGNITRHGVLSAKNEIIWSTTLAAIYPAQAAIHKSHVSAHIKAVLELSNEITIFAKAALVSNSWDSNYQHFLIDTLPKIHFLNSVLKCDVVFCVTDVSFIREICHICYPDRVFCFINDRMLVKATDFAYGMSPVSANMSPISPLCVSALKHLINTIRKFPSLNNDRRVYSRSRAYIARRNFKENHGNARVMINEPDLLCLLQDYGFATIAFEGLTLVEKKTLISNRSLFIAPVGSHLMNLIFTNVDFNIFIIDHPVAVRNVEWYFDTFKKVGLPFLTGKVIKAAFCSGDRPSSELAPYFTDISVVDDFISKLLY